MLVTEIRQLVIALALPVRVAIGGKTGSNLRSKSWEGSKPLKKGNHCNEQGSVPCFFCREISAPRCAGNRQ